MRLVLRLERLFLMSFVGLLFATGCATLIQPGPDHIQVRSEPEGASVYLNSIPIGKTPVMVSVNHKDDCTIDIKMDGYETATLTKGKVMSGWVLGNIILGGVIGLGVDLATYNQGHYPEEPIYVSLQPKKRGVAEDKKPEKISN